MTPDHDTPQDLLPTSRALDALAADERRRAPATLEDRLFSASAPHLRPPAVIASTRWRTPLALAAAAALATGSVFLALALRQPATAPLASADKLLDIADNAIASVYDDADDDLNRLLADIAALEREPVLSWPDDTLTEGSM